MYYVEQQGRKRKKMWTTVKRYVTIIVGMLVSVAGIVAWVLSWRKGTVVDTALTEDTKIKKDIADKEKEIADIDERTGKINYDWHKTNN